MNDITGFGKAIGPLSEGATDLLKRLLGPAVDEAGLAGRDVIRAFRTKVLAKILDRTKERLDQRGVTATEVRPRLLLPILESASLEDDDWMTERWADLLATAASGGKEVHPAFATILSELTPDDAQRLQTEAHRLDSDDGCPLGGTHRDSYYVDNWVRLGVVESIWKAGDGTILVDYGGHGRPAMDLARYDRLTVLGKSFLKACGAFPER